MVLMTDPERRSDSLRAARAFSRECDLVQKAEMTGRAGIAAGALDLHFPGAG